MSKIAGISLVVGLGNPGSRFESTWHNLGFLVLDWWAAQKKLTFKPGRGDYFRLTHNSAGNKITFLKPTPFMNLSGVPVAHLARYYRIAPENILVICDDVALPFGTLRIRKSGSDGGHRGLASVIAELGSEKIPRLRIGIFTEGWKGELSDYVLSPIPAGLHEDLRQVVSITAQALDVILEAGLTRAMDRFNRYILPGTPAKGVVPG